MLIFYLVILIPALYWVAKILLPEMAKPALPYIPSQAGSSDNLRIVKSDKVIERLESLLVDKNRSISLLETELKLFYAQVSSFDKVLE